jgi:hypothetical protein
MTKRTVLVDPVAGSSFWAGATLGDLPIATRDAEFIETDGVTAFAVERAGTGAVGVVSGSVVAGAIVAVGAVVASADGSSVDAAVGSPTESPGSTTPDAAGGAGAEVQTVGRSMLAEVDSAVSESASVIATSSFAVGSSIAWTRSTTTASAADRKPGSPTGASRRQVSSAVAGLTLIRQVATHASGPAQLDDPSTPIAVAEASPGAPSAAAVVTTPTPMTTPARTTAVHRFRFRSPPCMNTTVRGNRTEMPSRSGRFRHPPWYCGHGRPSVAAR